MSAIIARHRAHGPAVARAARRGRIRMLVAATALLVAATGCGGRSGAATQRIAGGSAHRGAQLITRFGCGTCHMIPGIDGANGLVGPPLIKWSRRGYIAGEVPNTPDFLIRWIEMPQAIEPGTDMPNLGVTEGQARDIAAYLYTIR